MCVIPHYALFFPPFLFVPRSFCPCQLMYVIWHFCSGRSLSTKFFGHILRKFVHAQFVHCQFFSFPFGQGHFIFSLAIFYLIFISYLSLYTVPCYLLSIYSSLGIVPFDFVSFHFFPFPFSSSLSHCSLL